MQNKIFKILAFFFALICATQGFAQDEKTEGEDLPGEPVFTTDTIPELDVQKLMKDEEEDEKNDKKKKKKKRKKKVFYGRKTRKGYTRKGVGTRQQLEMFYCLKKYEEPNFYVPEVYVWNRVEGKVEKLKDKDDYDSKFHKILHGPYKRTVGGDLVEQGIFYIGTKHGRWEVYDREDTEEFNEEEVSYSILLDKEKYYKGWPREARVTYYDNDRKKVKEVYPYNRDKQLHGTYYMFLENGQIFIKGEYQHGKKIGLWVEYFKDRKRRRKETQYPETPYEDKEPFVLNEWDEKNNPLIINGEKVKPGEKVEMDPIKRYFKNKK